MNKLKKFSFLCLLVILVLGAWIRLAGVITNSFAFTYDVGRDLITVSEIIYKHDVKLIGPTTGLPGLYYGPWWYYFLVPAFLLSEGDPQGIAVFIVFTGLVVVLVSYYFGVRVASKLFGLFLASLLAFSSYFVGLSIQIWNPNMAPLLLSLLFICLYYFFFSDKHRFLSGLCVGVSLGLILDSEIIFGCLLILSVLFYFILFKKKNLFSASTLLIATGILLTLVPRLFFELKHDFLMTRTVFELGSSPARFQMISGETLLDRLGVFFNLFTESVVGGSQIVSSGLITFIVVSILILKSKVSKKESFALYLSVTSIAVFFLGANLLSGVVWGHYLVGLPYFFILLTSLSFYLVYRLSKYKVLTLTVFFILLCLNLKPVNVVRNIFTPTWEGDAAVYRNQLAVLDYIYKDAQGRKFNYITYTPAVHDYNYQYLFSWYGNYKYGYIPEQKTENLLYAILEPEHQYPLRFKEWLDVRKEDGVITDENVVKGGIVVQKRIREL